MKGTTEDFSSFPGSEIVLTGIEDLKAGRETVDSAAVLVAGRRLRQGGLDVPDEPGNSGEPGHRLYELITEDGTPDPHSRYNAILRRVGSFARALEDAGKR